MIPASVRIFVCTEPQDLRRSFDGLALAARERLGEDPQSGALFCPIRGGIAPIRRGPRPDWTAGPLSDVAGMQLSSSPGRFPTPGPLQVGSRTGAVLRKAEPIRCSPFSLGVPHELHRESVSSPRLVERSVRISRTPLSCPLRSKGYGAYHVESAFVGSPTDRTR